MIHEKVMLRSNEAAKNAFMKTYVLDESREMINSHKRPAVVICPGGGYRFTSDREAEPIALSFVQKGIHAFVLRYSTGDAKYPQALLELAEAVKTVREHEKEWFIDPEQIFICGFSAGAHVCAGLGTRWDDELFEKHFSTASKSWKPNGMILSYPVISLDDFANLESRHYLLGDDASPEQLKETSYQNFVTERTAPSFLWHTVSDDVVPVENSLMFAAQLQKNKVPFEMHLYQDGAHGLSLCNEVTKEYPEQVVPENAGWIDLAVQWIRK